MAGSSLGLQLSPPGFPSGSAQEGPNRLGRARVPDYRKRASAPGVSAITVDVGSAIRAPDLSVTASLKPRQKAVVEFRHTGVDAHRGYAGPKRVKRGNSGRVGAKVCNEMCNDSTGFLDGGRGSLPDRESPSRAYPARRDGHDSLSL